MSTARLNGPQTTGREFRNLSAPEHGIVHDINVAVPVRDGVSLVADVHRPDTVGRFPVLVAASPYPRQIQDLGAPMGFIEAGNTEFWVSRGYVHLIANVRGTGGSGGEFGFFDSQERRDMHDLVEWAAAQPWCDGNVGMIGISYFAMTQLEAAVERPPHLKAIFPLAVTSDLFEAASHHGLVSSAFITPFLSMMGLTAARSDEFWRSVPLQLARKVLALPPLHRKFGTMNGEAAVTLMHQLLKLPHDPHPWDELWLDVFVNHPVRDEWWDDRDLTALLKNIDIPVYLGCDWENVPLHLPSTFLSWKGLAHNPNVQMGLLDQFGLTWPWESLHTEALAWYDHWLKGHDTGILDGDRVRYALPGAEGWHSSASWPPPATCRELALRADGALDADEGEPGARDYQVLGAGTGRVTASELDPPATLTWTSAELEADLDVVLEGVDLTSEGVAAHGHVDAAERQRLTARHPGVQDLGGQQDHPGTRSVRGHAVGQQRAQRLEQIEFAQQMTHRGRLATGDHQAVDGLQLHEPPHGDGIGSRFAQRSEMFTGIPLQCENPDAGGAHVADGVKSRW